MIWILYPKWVNTLYILVHSICNYTLVWPHYLICYESLWHLEAFKKPGPSSWPILSLCYQDASSCTIYLSSSTRITPSSLTRSIANSLIWARISLTFASTHRASSLSLLRLLFEEKTYDDISGLKPLAPESGLIPGESLAIMVAKRQRKYIILQ